MNIRKRENLNKTKIFFRGFTAVIAPDLRKIDKKHDYYKEMLTF